jgi:hypothetical protein
MTDAAAKHRAIGKTAPQGRRRLDEQTEGGAAGLFISGMPQHKERPSCRPCAKIEPAAFRQAEGFRVAVDFKYGRGKRPACQRRLCQPESIIQPARRCMENLFGIDAEPAYARNVGSAGFACEKTVGDPQHGPALMNLYGRGKRQDEACCRPGIIQGRRSCFGNGIEHEATIQGIVQRLYSERQSRPLISPFPRGRI